MNIEIEDVCPAKPKFEVGDVVTIPEASPDKTYVIKEAIDFGPSTGIVYEMFAPDNTERIIQFAESGLEFQYHDTSWEYYLNESVRNELPAWRGNIYNAYDIYEPNDLRYGEKYDIYHHDDTLPLHRMVHILTDHAIYHRINDLFSQNGDGNKDGTRDMVRNKMGNIKMDKFDKIVRSIQSKIIENNQGKSVNFTEDEWKFYAAFSAIDRKDLWRMDMTNKDIMRAIKDAYEDANKERVCRQIDTRNNGHGLPAPDKGKIIYRGESKKHGTIEFWYNLDLGIIETAYPIGMSDTQKH